MVVTEAAKMIAANHEKFFKSFRLATCQNSDRESDSCAIM